LGLFPGGKAAEA